MKNDYIKMELIDDSDDDIDINTNTNNTNNTNTNNTNKEDKKKKGVSMLKICHNPDEKVFEIGVDESGRGPLFGRVYTAAVILPKDTMFDFSKIKDSKKFHSQKKIQDVAEYIKEHSLAWHVSYEDEKKIDEINILQATLQAMKSCINDIISQLNLNTAESNRIIALIDGSHCPTNLLIESKSFFILSFI